MILEDLSDADDAHALCTLLERLKHDLGKYVGLQGRWLPPDASEGERRGALADDLLRTRRGPDGEVGAQAVWAPFAAVLGAEAELREGRTVALRDDPDVGAVFDAMEQLRPLGDEGAIQRLGADELAVARSRCDEVGARCRALVRRARAHVRSLHTEEG